MAKPWRQRYIAHLASPYWAELKRKVTARRGNKCERCGKSGCGLDLHHKHYRTLGRERQKDVMLLVDSIPRFTRTSADLMRPSVALCLSACLWQSARHKSITSFCRSLPNVL